MQVTQHQFHVTTSTQPVGEDNKLHSDILEFIASHPKPEEAPEQWVICKLFDAFGSATWWLTEYDAKERIGFGFVTGLDYDEWGTVSIDELAELHAGLSGMPGSAPRIEVDRYFRPRSKDEAVSAYYQRTNEGVQAQEERFDGDIAPIAEPGVLSLSEFVSSFGSGLLEAVRRQNPPVYSGVPNERREAVMDALTRAPFPAQREVVQAMAALLFDENDPAGIINAEMGTGKTMMAIAAAAVAHAEGYPRSLVICPPHLVYKWRREIKQTVPNARVWVLNGPDTLKKLLTLRQMREAPLHPEFFVMGRVRMRMGYHWKPSFIIKRVVETVEAGDTTIPGGARVACCPSCYAWVTDGDDAPLNPALAEMHLAKERRFCPHCHGALWTLTRPQASAKSREEMVLAAMQQLPTIGTKTARRLLDKFGATMLGDMLEDNVYEFINLMDEDGDLFFSDRQATRMERAMANSEFSFGQGGYQPTEFIKRYLPQGYFGLLIVDEGHEFKNEGSAQGQAFGVLARKCSKTLLLTGTLMGGYADDLFYLLWRLQPRAMMEDGFGYSRRGSLGPASMGFLRAHGVIKDIYKSKSDDEARSHRTARGRQTMHRATKGPGFGPNGIMRYVVPISAFLKLKQIGGNVLPPYEEHFDGVVMTPIQQEWYRKLEDALKQALKDALRAGDHSLLGVVLNALLAWPDCAFREEHVVHPHRRDRVLAHVPALFDGSEPMPKERMLIERVKAEKARGRRVLIYTVYTGTRDTTARLKALLALEGIKVATLSASVAAEKREDWVADQVDRGIDVLVTNPELVKTGLDLLEFPTIVFLQSGYNVYTLQQAARRSWRIGQKQAVDVVFLGYQGTAQLACLELMAKKIAVAQSTSGDMPESGLDVLNQSGDSIEVALARQLVA
jgi:superfamily II DNA or RNA helicase